jgi:hypothetical protein
MMIYREYYILCTTLLKQFGMKLPALKSEVMAFKVQFPIRSKTVTDKTSYEEEKDVT